MDSNKSQGKFLFGRQSSMAPERDDDSSNSLEDLAPSPSEIEEGVRLMFLANEGDLEGITEMLDSGVDVNFKDIDSRTPLHIASCQGLTDVVKLLLERGAEVGPKDRWGSTVSISFSASFIVLCVLLLLFVCEYVIMLVLGG